MMQLTRCSEGHFYDGSKYRTCPFCQQAGPLKATQPMMPPQPAEVSRAPAPPAASPAASPAAPGDISKTVGYYADMERRPVTGWLVIVEGPGRGKDFSLRPGGNYIGRSGDMDVVLDGDQMVSRNKHAIVVFDPVSRTTLCQPGESRELFYLNGKIVTEASELKPRDVLSIGKTKLVFIPFCSRDFSWDDPLEGQG